MAILLSLLFLAGMLTLEYERSWTAAGVAVPVGLHEEWGEGQSIATAASKYTLLEAGGRQGPASRDGRRDRAGSGGGWTDRATG